MTSNEQKTSFKQNFKSALAALFGIQSSKQREQDFKSHSPWRFILAGVIAIGLLLGTLLLVVQWVLS
ncbi:DUF2970 domain-containing protein [Motilimonas cestriensis]|uniref:DUF2970 domain-containing protein n=1 Tax=Motilimonas cestriensis TaxID=2742685 RepID=A0ABS8W919_9GAMM|nr:DUF2970 domain-containing protein [Motilimonas cestriensis]MCE2595003.1 DUF2970 domain-containing protein [Motilimonas cestriensis]